MPNSSSPSGTGLVGMVGAAIAYGDRIVWRRIRWLVGSNQECLVQLAW